MRTRRSRRLVLSGLVVVAMLMTGCTKRRELPTREGLPVTVNGVSYTVFITRELNPRDAEDRSYFQGPDAPPNFAYYGVFLLVCNDQKNGPTRTPANSFKIVDIEGNRYSPTALPPDNQFAYRPHPLAGKQCIPDPGTIAAQAPAGGSLLLFKLPIAASENRPLDLEVSPPPKGGVPDTQRIELDI